MREIRGVQQREAGLLRRWFSAPDMDLFVWQEANAIRAFELCYGKPADERSLRWREREDLQHTRIDDGEATPWHNRSPIAVPDGSPDLARLALTFEARAADIDPRVFRFVLGVLHRGG